MNRLPYLRLRDKIIQHFHWLSMGSLVLLSIYFISTSYYRSAQAGASEEAWYLLWQNILLSLLVLMLTYITQRLYLNRVIRIRHEKEIAEQKAVVKAKFLSTMSHEIRTPMNAVIGLSNILLQENPRQDQLDNLNTLKFSADLLLSLINDILDFSKIEAGKITFEQIDFNLPKLVNNIRNALNIKAQEKGLQLEVLLGDDIPTYVKGDQVRLSQIITNLVGNAVKFTQEGKVSIQLRQMPNGKIRFSVKDTGIGIPKEKFDQIFRSFSQADTNTTRRFGGTGLGLSITKKLLELQGSKIQLNSEVGIGSEFYFDLEFAASDQTPHPALSDFSQPHTKDFGKARILLVEDNKINVMVAQKFLRKWNLEVDVAYNGKEALEMLDNCRDYQVVLMDLNMPVMDGYAATQQVRARQEEHFQNLPIVALSASAISDFRTRALEIGMNEFVTKPFNPSELFEVLHRFIAVPV